MKAGNLWSLQNTIVRNNEGIIFAVDVTGVNLFFGRRVSGFPTRRRLQKFGFTLFGAKVENSGFGFVFHRQPGIHIHPAYRILHHVFPGIRSFSGGGAAFAFQKENCQKLPEDPDAQYEKKYSKNK
jgi:hypothetical protein